MRARLAPIFALCLVTACASAVDRGFAAYSSGRYDEAATLWNEPALRGDPIAQFNVGVLWENGHGATPVNLAEASQWYLKSANQGYVPAMVALARAQIANGHRDAAITWLILAERWNDQNAANLLSQLGQPVPSADLFAVSEAQRLAGQQALGAALGQFAYGATCAIAGGCAPPPGNRTTLAPGSVKLKCRPVDVGQDTPQYKCEN